MNDKTRSLWRALWVLPPVAIGVLILVLLVRVNPGPTPIDNVELARRVRVITVPQVALTPYAEAYGTAQPAQVWTAVAQVAGRVVYTHRRLRDGGILPAGTALLRIDPVDYELSLAQVRAELAELDVQESNANALRVLEERALMLAERERERIARLRRQGTVSPSDSDSAERNELASRVSLQNLRNSLALLPTQRKVLQAKLTQAERNLQHTNISAPFNLRVAGLAVEAEQYVGKGQNLFQGDAVDRVEVIAQVNIAALRNLFIGFDGAAPDITRLADELPDITGLRALVRLDMGGHIAEWQAEFVRFSDQIDSKTRTLGVVVAVDRPLDKILPGKRPLLSKGMLVQVLLRGRVQADRVIVPRTAVRAGKVYVVDVNGRLETRDVELLYSFGELSVVAGGVQPGEQLVVSDLVPAVSGMLLEPSADDDALEALLAAARDGL